MVDDMKPKHHLFVARESKSIWLYLRLNVLALAINNKINTITLMQLHFIIENTFIMYKSILFEMIYFRSSHIEDVRCPNPKTRFYVWPSR